jgi:hypothetical protein
MSYTCRAIFCIFCTSREKTLKVFFSKNVISFLWHLIAQVGESFKVQKAVFAPGSLEFSLANRYNAAKPSL